MNSALQRWTRIAAIAFGVVALCFGTYALITEPGVWRRMWIDLAERPFGPMWFRFALQPIMAALTAWKDGAKDAATNQSPYFWTVLTDRAQRNARLAEGFRATGKILTMGLVLDLIYQAIALKAFYPVEAICVATLLAFLPYLLLRGVFERIAALSKSRP
jgi:hypothetical protein